VLAGPSAYDAVPAAVPDAAAAAAVPAAVRAAPAVGVVVRGEVSDWGGATCE